MNTYTEVQDRFPDGRRLAIWHGDDADRLRVWLAEEPHADAAPEPTVVLDEPAANAAVVAWLRGPAGPVGPAGMAGPAGRDAPGVTAP